MAKEITDLQAKYLVGVEMMPLAVAERFLAILKVEIDAPFREERIARVERHIAGIYREARADADWENEWRTAAAEDKTTKECWLVSGATWVCDGYYTKWSYGGTEFYRWSGGFNRPSVVDEIIKVRVADVRLAQMIAEVGAIVGS